MKKIAVIGANEPLEPFYKQAYELGYELYGFAWKEGAVCKKYCKAFFPIDFREKNKILEKCKEIHIDGITSFSLESALPTVIYIASQMGLVQNKIESLAFIKDKLTMRKVMQESGIPIPEFWHACHLSEINSKNLSYPVIVKPVDNGGKKGVSLVREESELKEAFQYAVNNSKEGTALIESYISGREFSVEYLSFHGKHCFAQLTEKINTGAPHFVELEHHQPADVSQDELERIKKVTEDTLTALHITDSASHTELKIAENGEIFIIEVGARLGGGSITSDLVRLSTGIDMVSESLKLATGDFIPFKSTNIAYASKYYYISSKPWIKNLINSGRSYIYESNHQFDEREPLTNGDRSAWAICVDRQCRITEDNYLKRG